jgi:hypothetical protein
MSGVVMGSRDGHEGEVIPNCRWGHVKLAQDHNNGHGQSLLQLLSKAEQVNEKKKG